MKTFNLIKITLVAAIAWMTKRSKRRKSFRNCIQDGRNHTDQLHEI